MLKRFKQALSQNAHYSFSGPHFTKTTFPQVNVAARIAFTAIYIHGPNKYTIIQNVP